MGDGAHKLFSCLAHVTISGKAVLAEGTLNEISLICSNRTPESFELQWKLWGVLDTHTVSFALLPAGSMQGEHHWTQALLPNPNWQEDIDDTYA